MFSCHNKIESNENFKQTDLERLIEIKLLDKDEKIIQFYSQYKKSNAGNFFTNKRIAAYWFDERDSTKNDLDFAYYKNVIKLEPFFKIGLTYCPYILVTKSNNSTFKVYFDGTEKEKNNFLKELQGLWIKNSNL